jgi:FHA domain-containing protein
VSLLLRFEQRIEAVVEGLFTKWSRDRVHPVEIGRRVLREMEAGSVAGLHGALLPNDFRVFLNPKDFEPYQSFAPALVGELADLLRDRAAELGARLAGPVRVGVEPRDAIASGEIYVEARLSPEAEPSPGAPAASEETGAQADGSDTRIYRRARPAAGARLRVVAGPAGTAGRDFLLDRPVLTIGRRADQDIVIDDPSVSREHARLHVTRGEAAVEDLGSTNGTALNGRPIGRERVPVRDGDRIQVGNALLQYRSGS